MNSQTFALLAVVDLLGALSELPWSIISARGTPGYGHTINLENINYSKVKLIHSLYLKFTLSAKAHHSPELSCPSVLSRNS